MRPPPPPYPSTAVSSKQRAAEFEQMDTSGAGLVSGTNVPATTKQLPVISTAKVVTNRDALSAKMQQRNFVTQVRSVEYSWVDFKIAVGGSENILNQCHRLRQYFQPHLLGTIFHFNG